LWHSRCDVFFPLADVVFCLSEMMKKPSSNSTKNVIIIRHALSQWNARYQEIGDDPVIFDPLLTEKGRSQALALHPLREKYNFELVVTSPLTRAIDTMLLACFGTTDPTVLKERVTREKFPPIIVHPLLNEWAIDSCDIGCPPERLQNYYPFLDFRLLSTFWWCDNFLKPELDKDLADERQRELVASPEWTWQQYKEGKKESKQQLEERVGKMKQWIKEREEAEIVLFGHQDFFYAFSLAKKEDGEVYGYLLDNCEVETVEI